jgi:3-oxoacyl-[acyl-carrier-protein] synthase III
MSCYIVAAGASLPERVVTNAELAPLLGVTAEWIESSSGIRERRWVGAEQATSDLAAGAVRDALKNEGAEQIDYLIGGTLSPDYQVPGIAPIVQRKLAGCRNIPALDIRVGCCAILYSLQLAGGLVESRLADKVVCFGAEAQSKGLVLNRQSAELSMLFGDGAGAIVVSREPHSGLALRVEDILIATDGNFAEDLTVRAPGTANGARWLEAGQLVTGLHQGSFNGRSLILHAVRKLGDVAVEILRKNELSIDQVDLVIPHQANGNLLRSLGKKLGIADEKIVVNLDRYGNTSGASAFLALWQAWQEERLHRGAHVLILAFGAGYTWGAALCKVF